VCCSVCCRYIRKPLWYECPYCNTLQHTATHCNKQCVLQYVLQIYEKASLIWGNFTYWSQETPPPGGSPFRDVSISRGGRERDLVPSKNNTHWGLSVFLKYTYLYCYIYLIYTCVFPPFWDVSITRQEEGGPPRKIVPTGGGLWLIWVIYSWLVSFTWHDTFMLTRRAIDMWHSSDWFTREMTRVTHLYVWFTRDMTHSRDVTHSCRFDAQVTITSCISLWVHRRRDMTHAYAPWLIHMWHDLFIQARHAIWQLQLASLYMCIEWGTWLMHLDTFMQARGAVDAWHDASDSFIQKWVWCVMTWLIHVTKYKWVWCVMT